jgi:hypothetical protein
MKKIIWQISIIIAIIAFSVSTSQANTTLKMVLPLDKVTSGGTFTLNVEVSEVTNLYGVAFDVLFDMQIVKVLDVNEGTFLNKNGTQTELNSSIDNEHGKVIIGISRLGQVGGVTGSRTLCSISFKTIGNWGKRTLKFENVTLKDSVLDKIDIKAILGEINVISVDLRFQLELKNAVVNDEFQIDVIVENAVNLYATAFDVVFNPDILEIATITEGNFLNQDGTLTSFMSSIDNEQSRAIIGISRLGKASGITGSGTLCSILYITKAKDESRLNFESGSIKTPTLYTLGLRLNSGMVRIFTSLIGSISDIVTESNGVTPVGSVTLEALQNKLVKGSTTSRSDGRYNILNLQMGTYTVKATKSGYEPQEIQEVVVIGGENTPNIDFLLMKDIIPPAAIDNLSISKISHYEITLTWSASSDNGTSGIAFSYDIRYSTATIMKITGIWLLKSPVSQSFNQQVLLKVLLLLIYNQLLSTISL